MGDRWICVTKYHATSKGNLFIEDGHDITDRMEEIIGQQLEIAAIDVYARRN